MNKVKNSLSRLISYCRSKGWEGYDPYDGLNSRIFQRLPLFKNRLSRMAFLQFHKKSPFNLRPLFKVYPGRNPKGTGLFLLAFLHLHEMTKNQDYLPLLKKFINWLKQDISPGYSGACWGYNFPWQSRAFFLPSNTPTVVNTSFIGRAFIRAYEVLEEKSYLDTARSACQFILKDLNRRESAHGVCFSYSPQDRYFVHNATALASSLLALTYQKTGEENLAQIAQKSIRWVVDNQNSDGSWAYGEDPVAQKTGTDNFHTGFILESLQLYMDATGDTQYRQNLKKGLRFYQQNFFAPHFTSRGQIEYFQTKYFPHKTYPLDIHCAAQAVITLVKLRKSGADMDLCDKVIHWMMDCFQDEKGFFYYQKNPLYTNKIPYMRWSQAWTLLALAAYLSYGQQS